MSDVIPKFKLVLDPRDIATEVKRPIVAWDGQPRAGTETWTGKLTRRSTTPQVELRRLLDNGGTAVIRLNIGNSATNSKGKEVKTGIIMSSNKSVNLDWTEYYALREAIDEGVTRLVTEHENIYAEIARKVQEKANKRKESPAPASDDEAQDAPGDEEAPV